MLSGLESGDILGPSMSSSDSDSDLEDARLREAVDPEFNTKKSNVDSDKKKEQSLRRDKVKSTNDDGELVSGGSRDPIHMKKFVLKIVLRIVLKLY